MSFYLEIYGFLILVQLVYLPLHVSCKPESLNLGVIASLHDPIKHHILPLPLLKHPLYEHQSFDDIIEYYLYLVHLLSISNLPDHHWLNDIS